MLYLFNKKARPAGTFRGAGVGVPATCKASPAQEQHTGRNQIVKTYMAYNRQGAAADL